jgi:hypothetical protein
MQQPVSKPVSETFDIETQHLLLKSLVVNQDEYIAKLEDTVRKLDKILNGLTKALHAKNKLVNKQDFKIDQLKRKLRRRR